MVIYNCQPSQRETSLRAYDPNYPEGPNVLSPEAASRCFSMPINGYWEGGKLHVIAIYSGAPM